MLRDVVEESHFTAEFDALRDAYPEMDMDAVHAAMTWALASDARIGERLDNFPHPTIRVFKTPPIDEDTPSFLVMYRFTDKQVILLAIDRPM